MRIILICWYGRVGRHWCAYTWWKNRHTSWRYIHGWAQPSWYDIGGAWNRLYTVYHIKTPSLRGKMTTNAISRWILGLADLANPYMDGQIKWLLAQDLVLQLLRQTSWNYQSQGLNTLHLPSNEALAGAVGASSWQRFFCFGCRKLFHRLGHTRIQHGFLPGLAPFLADLDPEKRCARAATTLGAADDQVSNEKTTKPTQQLHLMPKLHNSLLQFLDQVANSLCSTRCSAATKTICWPQMGVVLFSQTNQQ